jgi:hypothetical protein
LVFLNRNYLVFFSRKKWSICSGIRWSLSPESPIIDPKGLCTDVSGLRRWGNGKIEASLHNISEIDSIIELIQQAFDKQMESS